MAVGISCEDNHAGGADIEAVNESERCGVQDVEHALTRGYSGDDTLHRTSRIPSARGKTHAGRFRDGDETIVGIEDARDHGRERGCHEH